jgi:hypothetical protein
MTMMISTGNVDGTCLVVILPLLSGEVSYQDIVYSGEATPPVILDRLGADAAGRYLNGPTSFPSDA